MKKFLTTVLVMCAAISLQAALHITIEQWVEDEQVITNITKDTTIVVTEYEWDEDLEEALMEVRGQLYSDESQNITVSITRQSTGVIDQFCAAGNCVPGNGGLTASPLTAVVPCSFSIATTRQCSYARIASMP